MFFIKLVETTENTHFESILIDGLNDFYKGHFRGECVSMINDRFSCISIPAVQFDTATASIQSSERKVTSKHHSKENTEQLSEGWWGITIKIIFYLLNTLVLILTLTILSC